MIDKKDLRLIINKRIIFPTPQEPLELDAEWDGTVLHVRWSAPVDGPEPIGYEIQYEEDMP